MQGKCRTGQTSREITGTHAYQRIERRSDNFLDIRLQGHVAVTGCGAHRRVGVAQRLEHAGVEARHGGSCGGVGVEQREQRADDLWTKAAGLAA